MPGWAWAVLAAVVLIALAVRSYYLRFRAMCRSVREDLREFLKQHYPHVEVLEERQGNLVLRTPDRGELVWELADVYADVAQLSRAGEDVHARTPIYHQSAEKLLAPPLDAEHPLRLDTHGDRIKPQLLRPDEVAVAVNGELPVATEVPGIGLCAAYVVDMPNDPRPLTLQDRERLGLSAEELHRLALANLRKDFPAEMIASALSGEATGIQFADGFDGARLLLIPEFLQEGQALLALAPHRDMLLLVPAGEDLEKLRQGLEMLEHHHPPLLRQPVRITAAGFTLV